MVTASHDAIAGTPGTGVTAQPDLSDFAASLETIRQTLRIPGMSVAVVQDQEVIFAQGFGYADLENRVPATPETPYGLASVTKPVAAVIIMQLVEEGLLALDTPVSQYEVEQFGEAVTVRHLLTHTSEGIPGNEHHYNGNRYGTLSGVIENVTGHTFAENLSERLLLPLEMHSTALNPINFWGESSSMGLRDIQPALGWGVNFRHYPQVYAKLAKPYQFDEDYNLIPGMYHLYHNAAAGMVSSLSDLAKFDIALDQGLLLGESAKAEMHAPAYSTYQNRPDLMYGLGWYVQEFEGVKMLWHTGRWPPSTSGLYLKIPQENLTLIVLANTDSLTTPFMGIGNGDVSKSLLTLAFFRHFIFPGRYGTALPVIDWSAPQDDILAQLSENEDEATRTYLERELWSFRQAYAIAGQKDQVEKLRRVNLHNFPNSVMRMDPLFTHTVGAFPVVGPNLSAAVFIPITWGIFLWLILAAVSVVGMPVILLQRARIPKYQWLYWLLSTLFLGPIALLIYRSTRSSQDDPSPSTWQSALLGSAFVVGVYALGWALALTLLPKFGQNPHPVAILGITYFVPFLVSVAFFRIPCVFSWGWDQPVRRLICSVGIELVSMNIAYAVMFPMTMLMNQWLTTIPSSFNPIYWVMLSFISVVNLLAQFPIFYWMLRRDIVLIRFRAVKERAPQALPTIKIAWPVLVVSIFIVVGALGVTISQLT
jgi:CubicO group peptidase (beta-lactamase class C family)